MNDLGKLRTYLFSYRYKGGEYGFEIPAYSEEEARGRLKALAFARYDGETMAKIPVAPFWLVRLWRKVFPTP